MTRNTVLMVAFHFPPLAGSSGVQRTLRFAQHLPASAWDAVVLSAHPMAYERTSDDLLASIPRGTVVERAWALDTARHLSIAGRYWGPLARPDRWMSWQIDAVRRGMAMIRRHRPNAIWSTYPIATAHLIGAELQRRSGLPWIADFRDPMAQDGYPSDPVTWQHFRRIEDTCFAHAALATFTTPGAAADYAQRYPGARARIRVIENGYDEETFAAAGPALRDAAATAELPPLQPGCVTLLHSGIVYPSERDPTQLFMALRALHDAGVIRPGSLRVRFRAPVAEALLHELARTWDVAPYVDVLPSVPYKDALAEMLRADGLLIMQASNCNAQIPAKLYEYLRAGRPLLCLSDPGGDTAGAIRGAGIDAIAPLDQPEAIAALLKRFLSAGHGGLTTTPLLGAVAGASRAGRAVELAAMLDGLARNPSSPAGAPAAGSGSRP